MSIGLTKLAKKRRSADNGSRPLSRQRAIKIIGDLISALGMPAVTSVMVGDPGKCIPLAAREHSVDLVLMSRPHAKSYGVYSNYLERVLRRLPCPLLTVSVDTHPSMPPLINNGRV